MHVAGVDLGFIKGGGGGVIQGANLLGGGVQSMLELGDLRACPPPPCQEIFEKYMLNYCNFSQSDQ